MDEIVALTRELKISNTPMLNSHRILRNYGDYERFTFESGSSVSDLLPEFYRDILWHPKVGIAAVRHLSASALQLLDKSLNKKVELTKKLLAADLPVYIGSNPLAPFYVPGFSLHQEAGLFRQILDFNDEKIIALLTVKAAEHLGEEKLGKINVGSPADLLLWKNLPDFSSPTMMEEIGMSSRSSIPDAVIKDGCFFPRASFENRLTAWREQFDQRVWQFASNIYARLFFRRIVDFWV